MIRVVFGDKKVEKQGTIEVIKPSGLPTAKVVEEKERKKFPIWIIIVIIIVVVVIILMK